MIDGHWLPVKDGDERAFALYKRHYSYHEYRDGRRRHGYRNRFLIMGPGEKEIFITVTCDALIAFRKFIDDSGQEGVNLAIFRNEGAIRSSALLLEAEQLAWRIWPGERLYTYVNPKRIRTGSPSSGKPNPGKCFVKAGWVRLKETTKDGLVILEKCPAGQRS